MLFKALAKDPTPIEKEKIKIEKRHKQKEDIKNQTLFESEGGTRKRDEKMGRKDRRMNLN